MPKSAKSFRQNLRKSGVFFTPKKLAEYMRSFFPSDVPEIYDPTCGDGGLLAEFDGAKKYGQEIDAEQGNYAATNLVNAEIEIGNTIPKYLYHYLCSRRGDLKQRVSGVIPCLKTVDLKNFPVILPPLEKQIEIVNRLNVAESYLAGVGK